MIRRSAAVVCTVLLLAAVLVVPASEAKIRAYGSLGAQAYGYEDYNCDNHLWLMQTTRLNLQQVDGPWSLHLSGGYLGDDADDFSKSGRDRLTRAYLEYGGIAQPTRVRAGRFFLARGVALGTLDGVEATHTFSSKIKATVYAGMMGPLTRKFEVEDPDQAVSFGGEVQVIQGRDCMIADHGMMAFSYTHQTRNERVYRHRIGWQSRFRWGRSLTLFNTVQVRPMGSVLRKIVSRARYNTADWFAMLELGGITPDVDDESYFTDLNSGMGRVRASVNRWIERRKWGGGLEFQTLIVPEGMGFRGGPIVYTPVGELGYRFGGGDRSVTSGPWVNLRYDPVDGLRLYAYGSYTTYEWEQFDIEQEEYAAARIGARWRLPFYENLEVNGEYQVYQTARLTEDKRALGGLRWTFDTRGGAR
ncbi:hypothetical protein GF324_02160 [bacterium]|nr:hypothetical protein [bacterium]